MSGTSGSAARDLLKIYWRHHNKGHLPPGLKGKQVGGEDLTQLANVCCSVIAVLIREPEPKMVTVPSLKQTLEDKRNERKCQQIYQEPQRLMPLLQKAMAELTGDEWYYFWGLHQIFDILPQAMEEI